MSLIKRLKSTDPRTVPWGTTGPRRLFEPGTLFRDQQIQDIWYFCATILKWCKHGITYSETGNSQLKIRKKRFQ